jgi:hypothetical protein
MTGHYINSCVHTLFVQLEEPSGGLQVPWTGVEVEYDDCSNKNVKSNSDTNIKCVSLLLCLA